MSKPLIDMFDAVLCKVTFDGFNMSGVNFRQSKLDNIFFRNSFLERSNFWCSSIQFSRLDNNSFVRSNFEGAKMLSSTITNSDFTGANLTNCEWFDCHVDKCIFTDAITDGFIVNGRPFSDTGNDVGDDSKIKQTLLFLLKNTIVQNELGKPCLLDKPNYQIDDNFEEALRRLEECGISIKQSKSKITDAYTRFEFRLGEL